MAGPRHNWDEQSHKNLFDKVYNTITTTVSSITKLVNDNLGDIKEATNLPTPNTLMKRDEYGRVRVTEPTHELDVVTKGYLESRCEFYLIIESGIFKAPKTGIAFILLINGGAGGSNGGVNRQNGGASIPSCIPMKLVKGKEYSVVIGAGGAGGAGGGEGGALNLGRDGGATYFDTLKSASSYLPVQQGYDATPFGAEDIKSGNGTNGNHTAGLTGVTGFGSGGGAGGSNKRSGNFHPAPLAGGAGAQGICVVFY